MAATLLAVLCSSFLRGDPLPLMIRSQVNEQRTQWREVPHDAAPRFGVKRSGIIHIKELYAEDADHDAPQKISLALLGMQFSTPWIAAADGQGRFLSMLRMRLTASGDTVAGVRWEPEYTLEEPPPHVEIATEWEHVVEEDTASALGLLFGSTSLVLGILLSCMLAQETTAPGHREEKYQTRTDDSEPAGHQPLHGQLRGRDPATKRL